MQLFTATVTFASGTAVKLSTIAKFAAIPNLAVAYLRIEPAAANSHVVYVGDSGLSTGTSTVDHVIRQLGVPTSATSALDDYEIFERQGGNKFNLSDFAVDGTTNEQARVTVFVG